MTNPRYKEIWSFFLGPQFRTELGLEPGAGLLLTAVAAIPRGGRGLQVWAQVYPERASLSLPT